jgi:hypothetical protein
MSLLDDSAALDQTTPWAPTVPLAPPPEATPQPAVKPGKITPETHPGYFNAPAAGGAPAGAQPAGGDYMATVRRRESGGNDMAGNGTAFGRYQFTQRTWLGVAAAHPELGLRPEDIWNGDKQDQAMKALTADNSRVLQKEGFDPTPSNLYMMHFLGTGGGPKFLKAMQVEPTTNAAALFPLEAKYNPTIFFHGGDPNQPRNLSQIYGMMTKDFDGTAFDATQTKSVENSQPQVASDAISDATNDASAPPLPPGARLVPMDEDTKATASEAPPLPPGAKMVPFDPQEAYAQDVGKNPYAEADKDKPPDYAHRLMANLAGDPEFLAPKSPGEFAKDEASGAAGALAGAARAPFELFSGIPGDVGEGSAEAARLLGKVGSPQAQTFGNVAAQLVPVGAGAKAAGTVGKELVEEGPTLARLGRGVFEGARGGAGAGLMTPTDETDPKKRADEKLKQAMVGGAVGGAAGGAFPAIAGGAKWVGKEVGDVWGGEARRLSEELRKGVNAETGKALTAEERTAKLAQIDKMGAKKEAAAGVADTAAHQEKITAEAAEAAKPVSTPEALGEQVHQTAVADMEALKAERATKSGFDKAVKSDGGAPSVPTGRFAAEAKAAEAETKSSELKAALSQFRKSLTNAPSVKGQPAIQAVSIRQAREILETLNKHIDEMSPNAAHRLTEVRDDFLANLEKTHPQMKAAREAYARLSRPLDVYERTGALKKAAMEDPYSGAGTMDPVAIKRAVTGKTQAGAEALQRLIQKNPAIRESTRNVLQHELYGSGATARTPTAAQLRSFLSNNRMVLEKTGLDKEFSAIKPSLEAVEAAPRRAAETQRNIEDLAKTKTKAVAARSDIRRLEIEMNEPKNTPKQIVSAAESTAKKLYDRGSISEAQYQKFFSAVREAETKNADHEHAVRLAKMVGAAVAVGLMGEEAGRYIQHRVNVR